MRSKEEWLYPPSVTPTLRSARGDDWQALTDYISSLDEEHEDSLAFGLLMVQLCGCVTCQPGSYKLSLGCGTCAFRAVANARQSDGQMLKRYQNAQRKVQQFFAKQRSPVS